MDVRNKVRFGVRSPFAGGGRGSRLPQRLAGSRIFRL